MHGLPDRDAWIPQKTLGKLTENAWILYKFINQIAWIPSKNLEILIHGFLRKTWESVKA